MCKTENKLTASELLKCLNNQKWQKSEKPALI